MHQLQIRRQSVRLTDDVGTEFRPTGAGSGGGGGERRGHSDFVPGVPSTAKLLTVHWDDMEFAIPLPPVRGAS